MTSFSHSGALDSPSRIRAALHTHMATRHHSPFPVATRQTTGMGRSLVAVSAVSAGSVVLREESPLTVLLHDTLATHCGGCCAPLDQCATAGGDDDDGSLSTCLAHGFSSLTSHPSLPPAASRPHPGLLHHVHHARPTRRPHGALLVRQVNAPLRVRRVRARRQLERRHARRGASDVRRLFPLRGRARVYGDRRGRLRDDFTVVRNRGGEPGGRPSRVGGGSDSGHARQRPNFRPCPRLQWCPDPANGPGHHQVCRTTHAASGESERSDSSGSGAGRGGGGRSEAFAGSAGREGCVLYMCGWRHCDRERLPHVHMEEERSGVCGCPGDGHTDGDWGCGSRDRAQDGNGDGEEWAGGEGMPGKGRTTTASRRGDDNGERWSFSASIMSLIHYCLIQTAWF